MAEGHTSSDEDDLGGIDEELLELQAVLGLDYRVVCQTLQHTV